MKAGIYLGKENVELQELPWPEVGDNDVLVQNLYSSVCGTDVAVFKLGPNTGHKITVGTEFGHETVSRVVKVGKNITDFTVGERVYPYPLFAKDDTSRAGTIGGFSEYILIPNAKRNHSLYAVDERISDRLASLIEPFTVGCRAARRGMIPCGNENYIPGQNAVVFGSGTIGLAAAVAFKHFGMSEVMVCDRSDFRLKLAAGLGFSVCNTNKEDFTSKAKEHFGTAPSLSGATANIDCWLDAAGAESILADFGNVVQIPVELPVPAITGAAADVPFIGKASAFIHADVTPETLIVDVICQRSEILFIVDTGFMDIVISEVIFIGNLSYLIS